MTRTIHDKEAFKRAVVEDYKIASAAAWQREFENRIVLYGKLAAIAWAQDNPRHGSRCR